MDEQLLCLPLADRIERFREFAERALNSATASPNEEVRAALLGVSLGWSLLAHETAGIRTILFGDHIKLIKVPPANELN